MRQAKILLELWNNSSKENPIILGDRESSNEKYTNNKMYFSVDEVNAFFKTLKEMNRPGYSASFQISRDYEGYTCPITDKWVEGKAAHRENLKVHGCRVFEPGELEEFKRNKPREVERNAEIYANQICEKIGERIGDL